MNKEEIYYFAKNSVPEDIEKNWGFGYVVSKEWWTSWEKYSLDKSGTILKPKSLKNYEYLCGFEIKIKEYVLLNPVIWDVIKKDDYDCKPELKVFVIKGKPDFRPINIYLFYKEINSDLLTVSKHATMKVLKRFLIENYQNLDVSQVITIDSVIVDDDDKTLAQLGAKENSSIRIGKGFEESECGNEPLRLKRRNNFIISESERFNVEDIIEPDPDPWNLANEVPENQVIEMVKKAQNEPYLDISVLSHAEIAQKINAMLERIESSSYDF